MPTGPVPLVSLAGLTLALTACAVGLNSKRLPQCTRRNAGIRLSAHSTEAHIGFQGRGFEDGVH